MIETLDTWWSGLALVVKVFYVIGMVSTAIIGVQTVLSLIGLDFGDGADADGAFDGHGGDGHHGDGDGDVGFLSLRTILAFLVGFGWVGALLLKSEVSIWIVLLVAPLAGIVLMFLIFFAMRLLWSLREDGTLDYRNAVGEIATVYLPVPGERSGKGQVEVMMQGRLQTVPAVTSRTGRLENRSRVLVVDVLEDNTLVVIPEE